MFGAVKSRAWRRWILRIVVTLLLLPTQGAAQVPPPMPAPRTVEVFGQAIRYYEAGEGRVVILVHGLGSEAAVWALSIGPLSAKHRVIALDQVGFGDSAKPRVEYRIETFVEFLDEFMRMLGIPRATLVGNSLGGWIVAEFATRHPEKVEKLVLVTAAGLTPEPGAPPLAVDLNPASLSRMRKLLETAFYDRHLVTEGFVRQAFEQRLRRGDGYTVQRVLATLWAGDQYLDAKLGSVRAPTLVVWGRDDALTLLSLGERLHRGIAGSRLVVFEQCGHVPQMEKAADFNKALLEFLSQP